MATFHSVNETKKPAAVSQSIDCSMMMPGRESEANQSNSPDQDRSNYYRPGILPG